MQVEKEVMVTVPYGDFVDGMKAMADLDAIRAMITGSGEYASKAVMSVLGLEKSDDTQV